MSANCFSRSGGKMKLTLSAVVWLIEHRDIATLIARAELFYITFVVPEAELFIKADGDCSQSI